MHQIKNFFFYLNKVTVIIKVEFQPVSFVLSCVYNTGRLPSNNYTDRTKLQHIKQNFCAFICFHSVDQIKHAVKSTKNIHTFTLDALRVKHTWCK